MRVSLTKRQSKNGVVYYIDYRINHRRIRKSLGSDRAMAKIQAAEIQKELILGRSINYSLRNISFLEFSKEYLQATGHRRRVRTAVEEERRLRLSILPFFGELRLKDITQHHIEKWQSWRSSKNAKPGTVNRELTSLRAMLLAAKRWNYLPHSTQLSFSALPDPQRSDRFLSNEEAASLLRACENGPKHLYGFVLMALHTGMRWSEIRFLKWEDVDLTRRVIRVVNSAEHTTKSGKIRFIPISTMLHTWLASQPGTSTWVFASEYEKPFKQIHKSFKRACEVAKIRSLRFHDLRHTFCSHLAMNGTPLQTIMELMGHSSLRMVLRYAHLAPSHKAAMIESLEFGTKHEVRSQNGHKSETDACRTLSLVCK